MEAGKITFTPKSVVDRDVAESLGDFAAVRSFGPFKTDKELIKSLHQEAAEVTASYSKRFLKQYAAAPLTVSKAFDKQASLLLGNFKHPSLHAKKYNEAIDLWQAGVNRGWRYPLHEIVKHPK